MSGELKVELVLKPVVAYLFIAVVAGRVEHRVVPSVL